MSRSPLNRPNERGNVGSGWPITRRRLLIAIGACLWGAGHHTNAQANKSDGPQVGDLAGDLLAWAAQQVQSLKRVRFKIHYEKGSTTLYRKIKMRKVEGAVVRPDRMKATAEAKLGFLGVDVHATMIGEHVWVESFRIDDEFDVEPGMALLVNDPIRYAPAAAAAIENPMVTRVEGGTIWTRNCPRLLGSSRFARSKSGSTSQAGSYRSRWRVRSWAMTKRMWFGGSNFSGSTTTSPSTSHDQIGKRRPPKRP
jgi:hypothetical protein